MNAERSFIDSNVALYLVSEEQDKAERADRLVNAGVWISVQVLNECVSVARRKLKMPWNEVHKLLGYLRSRCPVATIQVTTHERALDIAEATGIRIYDALMIAAAEEANCGTLFTEDLNHGQRIGGVTVRNPFI